MKVVICENHLQEKQLIRETMMHESVHAFDDCRAKVDWTNCVHHACSEVHIRGCNPKLEQQHG